AGARTLATRSPVASAYTDSDAGVRTRTRSFPGENTSGENHAPPGSISVGADVARGCGLVRSAVTRRHSGLSQKEAVASRHAALVPSAANAARGLWPTVTARPAAVSTRNVGVKGPRPRAGPATPTQSPAGAAWTISARTRSSRVGLRAQRAKSAIPAR